MFQTAERRLFWCCECAVRVRPWDAHPSIGDSMAGAPAHSRHSDQWQTQLLKQHIRFEFSVRATTRSLQTASHTTEVEQLDTLRNADGHPSSFTAGRIPTGVAARGAVVRRTPARIT